MRLLKVKIYFVRTEEVFVQVVSDFEPQITVSRASSAFILPSYHKSLNRGSKPELSEQIDTLI